MKDKYIELLDYFYEAAKDSCAVCNFPNACKKCTNGIAIRKYEKLNKMSGETITLNNIQGQNQPDR